MTGIRVVWRGITSRPTTATKITFRKGKLIQAKAYAANAATKSGMIVEGIVMNRLVMNASPGPLWPRTVAYLSSVSFCGDSRPVHQPELATSAAGRNELTSRPIVGISQNAISTLTTKFSVILPAGLGCEPTAVFATAGFVV